MIVIALLQGRKLRDETPGHRRNAFQFPINVKHRYQFGAAFHTRMQNLEAEMAIATGWAKVRSGAGGPVRTARTTALVSHLPREYVPDDCEDQI
jgi:hypothetical protein